MNMIALSPLKAPARDLIIIILKRAPSNTHQYLKSAYLLELLQDAR